MTIKMTVSGLRRLQHNFDLAPQKMQDALSAGLYQEAMIIIGEAKKRTPVDTGRLRQTGYAAPPENGPRGPECECGFGTKYAVFVHEILSSYHPVGQAKFLESVVNERRRGYVSRLAKRTAQNYARGIGVRAILPTVPGAPK